MPRKAAAVATAAKKRERSKAAIAAVAKDGSSCSDSDGSSSSGGKQKKKKDATAAAAAAPFAPVFSILKVHEDEKDPSIVKVARIGERGEDITYVGIKYGDGSGPQELAIPVAVGSELIPTLPDLPVANLKNRFPNRLYAAGTTLSGKSHVIAQIAREYSVVNPNSRIVLITALESDPVYKTLEDILTPKKRFVRLMVDEAFGPDVEPDDEIKMADLKGRFKKCLCIFDDFDQVGCRETVKNVTAFLQRCLTAGRHHQISLAVTRQVALNGIKTVSILTQTFSILMFPHSSGRHHCIAFLKKYLGMPDDEIAELLAKPSRWLLIQRTPPRFAMTQYSIKLI